MLKVNHLTGFGSRSANNLPAGLSIWARYKASSQIAVGDGNAVTQLDDISGNARHATQGTSSRRAILRTAASGLVGNTVAYDFQGDNTNPHQYALPSMTALTQGEIFFWVIKDDDDATNARRLHQIGSATDFYYVYLDHGIYDGFGSTVRKTAGDPTPSVTVWHNYSVRSKASDWECYINNSSIFSTATNTVGFPASPQIGGYVAGTTSTRLCKGKIAEVVILSTATDAAGRADIHTYFLNEYT
jgi:hypothetical protein